MAHLLMSSNPLRTPDADHRNAVGLWGRVVGPFDRHATLTDGRKPITYADLASAIAEHLDSPTPLTVVASRDPVIAGEAEGAARTLLPHYVHSRHALCTDTVPLTSNWKVDHGTVRRILNDERARS